MKTLREFISAYPISRANMPQINDIESFKKFLDSEGIGYHDHEVPIDSVRPTQQEFDADKVESMMGDLDNQKQIIVSSDYDMSKANTFYILDGHHRYFSHVFADKETINTLMIEAPLNIALRAAYNFNEMSNQ